MSADTSPSVCVCFDDILLSAWETATPLLERYDATGTFFVSGEVVNRTRGLSGEIVRHLSSNDHEVACHTYSHLKATEVSLRDFADDIARNERWFAELGIPSASAFAFPYGEVSLAANEYVIKRFRYVRYDVGGINDKHDSRVVANKLYSCRFSEERIREQIDAVCRSLGVVVYYTHDVADAPSRFGCTRSELEFVLNTASQVGAKLISFSVAMNLLRQSR